MISDQSCVENLKLNPFDKYLNIIDVNGLIPYNIEALAIISNRDQAMNGL